MTPLSNRGLVGMINYDIYDSNSDSDSDSDTDDYYADKKIEEIPAATIENWQKSVDNNYEICGIELFCTQTEKICEGNIVYHYTGQNPAMQLYFARPNAEENVELYKTLEELEEGEFKFICQTSEVRLLSPILVDVIQKNYPLNKWASLFVPPIEIAELFKDLYLQSLSINEMNAMSLNTNAAAIR